MATILNFRNKERASSAHDFLTDETEKLSFRTAEDGVVSIGEMSSACLPSPLPDPRKDWRNQELADLFRVRQLLIGAGVPVETMRGITDEGDPWFIYCHFNGDVFIHMARIDGIYVLDSPNVRRPLRGADFNALIADFTTDALPTFKSTGDDDDTKRRVVRLERGGKVRLHPSAMLAALIWTLFLASEELVLLTPEDHATTDDDLLDFSDMIFPAGFEIHTVETESADIASLTSADAAKDLSSDILNTEAQVQIRDGATTGQQGLAMHQNAFAMGLSTIAIAMGFMSEAVLLDNQRKVLDGLKALGFTGDGADAQDADLTGIADNAQDSAFLAKLAEFLGIDLVIGDEQAEVAQIAPKTSVLQDDLTHLGDEVLTADKGLPPTKVIPPSAFQDKNTEAKTPVEGTDKASRAADALTPAKATETATSAEAAKDSTKISSLSEAIQVWQQTQAKDLHVGVIEIKADLDMSITDAYALFTLRETPGEAQSEVPTASTFDPMSQRLIDFFMSKGSDIGIIDQANGFLAVDREAVKSGDVTYMEWETDDGKLIGLIGFASDFQQFDMIA